MFGTWGSVVLTGAALALSVWAGLRLARLGWRFQERRLGALSLFFLFYALAQAVLALETVLLLAGPPVRTLEEVGLLQGLFWGRHAAFLVALVAAVAAVGPPRFRRGVAEQQQAGVGVPLFMLAHPVLLVVQGIGLFYLVVRSAANHARRSDPGSLRVALGFSLLLVGHLSPFIMEPEGPPVFGIPGGGSAFFVLAGVAVLFWSTWGGRGPVGEDG